MVIEHSFVTTMEAAQAMEAAADLLLNFGFRLRPGVVFQVHSETPSSFEMMRGKTRASSAKSVAELPQRIRVEFDRGRVQIAASITPSAKFGGSGWANIGFGIDATGDGLAKKMTTHQNLLMTLVTYLEEVLVRNADQGAIVTAWQQMNQTIVEAGRKEGRRRTIVGLVLLAFVVAAIVLVVVMAVTG